MRGEAMQMEMQTRVRTQEEKRKQKNKIMKKKRITDQIETKNNMADNNVDKEDE